MYATLQHTWDMEDDAPVIYGLEFQARALTSQTAESDAIRFLVGTQSLKFDNQIHIIDFDDENNIISKSVLQHQAGEIWHISASPADKAVLTTCYNKTSESRVVTCGAVWRMPPEWESGSHESPDDPHNSHNPQNLELLCHLDNSAHGNASCVLWEPMGDGKRVISLADNHALLWDLTESSTQATWKALCPPCAVTLMSAWAAEQQSYQVTQPALDMVAIKNGGREREGGRSLAAKTDSSSAVENANLLHSIPLSHSPLLSSIPPSFPTSLPSIRGSQADVFITGLSVCPAAPWMCLSQGSRISSSATLEGKGQLKFTAGKWSPHHNCTQLATANDTAIRGWDLRTMSWCSSCVMAACEHGPVALQTSSLVCVCSGSSHCVPAQTGLPHSAPLRDTGGEHCLLLSPET
ncbi:unnamed protein product [Coregonus sp. 'balchen']|nr:unnamed protein product [Coregonus sp. 'balchen']